VRARGAGEREKRERAREDDAEAALGNHHGEARSDAADDGTFETPTRVIVAMKRDEYSLCVSLLISPRRGEKIRAP
jgi:hypothetical protein